VERLIANCWLTGRKTGRMLVGWCAGGTGDRCGARGQEMVFEGRCSGFPARATAGMGAGAQQERRL